MTVNPCQQNHIRRTNRRKIKTTHTISKVFCAGTRGENSPGRFAHEHRQRLAGNPRDNANGWLVALRQPNETIVWKAATSARAQPPPHPWLNQRVPALELEVKNKNNRKPKSSAYKGGRWSLDTWSSMRIVHACSGTHLF